jgi:hypothetical protein
MSLLSAVGSRPIQSHSLRSSAQDSGGAHLAPGAGKLPAQLPVADAVSRSSGSVSLSQQALNARLSQLGDQTVDVAQRLIGNFAEALFGDAAKGATFNFDAISVSADTSLSAAVMHWSDSSGSADAAALQFNESASFIGRGQIVTSDGQPFDFEIEVRYEASVSAASAQTSAPAQAGQNPVSQPETVSLTGKQLPAIQFPGSLADLFKVLGRQLELSSDSGKNDGNGGNLSLRLIRLVNSAALLAPRAQADSPQASALERSRALAAYATPAASNTLATA